MKKCPFCKNEITVSLTQCPVCKMTLMEKVSSIRSDSKYTYSSPPPKSSQQETYSYNPPIKEFKISKSQRGWLISIIGSILLTAIINHDYTPSNPLPPPLPTSEQTQTTTKNEFASVLLNGKVLFSDPSYLNGSGTLTISNGSGSDAVVKLITNSGRKVYSVYVSTNNKYSIENIDDDIYRVLFSFGDNWDSDQKKFTLNPRAQAFDDTFDFKTTYDGEYIKSTIANITLNPVINGNARTNPIGPEEFDKY